MALNSYYNKSISDFLKDDPNQVCKELAFVGGNSPEQLAAWEEEIGIMREVLMPYKSEEGRILFEYTIPRMGKRIDVVLLLRGVILVIEFKSGEKKYLRADAEQAMDYALDLKYFHEESEKAPIVPILVATRARTFEEVLETSSYHDQVYTPVFSNASSLSSTVAKIVEDIPGSHINLDKWGKSNYQPTPTIIEAARTLYADNTVEDITRTEASAKSIYKTIECVKKIVKETKETQGRTICFVTGVPGAGKTLVGLNIAFMLDKEYREADSREGMEAVYMSGNGPLVKVLQASLAKDKIAREKAGGKKKTTKVSDALREASTKLQGIAAYREYMLHKIKTPIKEGETDIAIDPEKAVWSLRNGYAADDHIAIFDEAQRCWNKPKLAEWLKRGGSYGNKMKVPNFPMSEAEFLVWTFNLRPDWAVIICLVGGGQEINSGEAGIGEWIRAINSRFPEWRVCISDQLKDPVYKKGNTKEELSKVKSIKTDPDLHLSVSMRSFRAKSLAKWVEALLHFKVDDAQKEYDILKSKYPIVLTRSIDKAKEWLKVHARGSERYGMIVSSKAARLRPLAIDIKRKINVVNWFLADRDNVGSSYYLEDTATEFDIQGLELDWTCVVWDGDMRYKRGKWAHHQFKNSKWNNINQEQDRDYQENAYRVLLTRARQGMVICVPEGNSRRNAAGEYEDPSRKPEIYDSTYKYLKSLGLEEI